MEVRRDGNRKRGWVGRMGVVGWMIEVGKAELGKGGEEEKRGEGQGV